LDTSSTNEALQWLRSSHGNGLYFSLQALAWRLSKIDDGRHAIVVDRRRIQQLTDDQVERYRWPIYPLSTLRILAVCTTPTPSATGVDSSSSASVTDSAAVTFAPLAECVGRMVAGVHMVILLLQPSANGQGVTGAHIRLVLPAPDKMDGLLATMSAQKIPLLYELIRPVPSASAPAAPALSSV
jgi:hypothetical protein